MERSSTCRCKRPDVYGVGEERYCLGCGASVLRGAKLVSHAISQAASMSKFRYWPLRYHSSIRLVRLEPGQREDEIIVDIYNTMLNDETPSFEALSYTWGSNDLSQKISTGYSSICITRNCESALKDIRLSDRPRLLWIDALCINQESNEEKNHQVPLMSTIYAKAARVIVYLGPDADGAAASIFSGLQQRRYLAGFPKRLTQSRLSSFLSMPWFSRVWVLQEVAVAREIEVMWGATPLPWRCLSVAYVSALNFTMVDMSGHVPPALLMGKKDPTPLNDLVSLIYTARRCHSSDARDKIFALIGLLRGDRQGVDINYGRTLDEVKVELTTNIISSYNNLDVISLANTEIPEDADEIQEIKIDFGKSVSIARQKQFLVMRAMYHLTLALDKLEKGREIDLCTRKVAEALSQTLLNLAGLQDFFERYRLIQGIHSEILSWDLPILPRRKFAAVSYKVEGQNSGYSMKDRVYGIDNNPEVLHRIWEARRSTFTDELASVQWTSIPTNQQSFVENEIWGIIQEIQNADREALKSFKRLDTALCMIDFAKELYPRDFVETLVTLHDKLSRAIKEFGKSFDGTNSKRHDEIGDRRDQLGRESARPSRPHTDTIPVENMENLITNFEVAAVDEGIRILYEILNSLWSSKDLSVLSTERAMRRDALLQFTEESDRLEKLITESYIATNMHTVSCVFHADHSPDMHREVQRDRSDGLSWAPGLGESRSLKTMSSFRYTTNTYRRNVGRICSQHPRHAGFALEIRLLILSTVQSRSLKNLVSLENKNVNADNLSAENFHISCDLERAQTLNKFCKGRRLMLTDSSWIICSRQVQKSDKVCALYGATVPFVLRPLGKDTYRLVGECFLDGFGMSGHAEDYITQLGRFNRWPSVTRSEDLPWQTVCLE